ncbi:Hsp20/alpha crystallin family protein [Bacillus weihaiensis]|uniref:SHSP domain-containing protein n=1 Tax=Bacillus weihaiensis TaxID=1547283 RepID=A0A1L3MVV8_9BACI|nr:Hsp20/alpha crystallin family protein [Bacillus weihaiensis]APH06476.1 hypothetical protein A9C19_18015 [Bacillus weihaiensis]
MPDPMKLMNEFFQKRPNKTLLDTIDGAFRKQSYASFSTDINETKEHFTITAALPGVAKEQIHVEMSGDTVVIEVKENREGSPRHISGTRTISLPDYVVKRNMKAVYRHGLLEIQLEKKKPRRIEIE